MRKSFIIHNDSLEILDELTDEQAGRLFKAIANYHSGKELDLDVVTKLCFSPFKNQFIRDNKCYNEKVEVRSLNGKLGNLKRWHEDLYTKVIDNQMNIEEATIIAKHRNLSHSDTLRQNVSPPFAKSLVSDSVSVSVSNIDNTTNNNNSNFNKYSNRKDTLSPKIEILNIELKKEYLKIENRDLLFIAKYIRDKKPQFIEPYVECWNYFAEKFNKQKIIKLSETRKRKLLLRLKDDTFVFPEILNKAKNQSFILENNFFTFDWVIENETNYLKVLEGNYKDAPKEVPISRYTMNK